jgi:hypothetical protein
MDAVSSTDEYQAPVKPKIKRESTTAHHSAVSLSILFDTEARVHVVLAPDSDEYAIESFSDNKSQSDGSVTESASEDEGLTSGNASVRQQLQSEV